MTFIAYIFLLIFTVVVFFCRERRTSIDFQTATIGFFGLYYVMPGLYYSFYYLLGIDKAPYPSYQTLSVFEPILASMFLAALFAGFWLSSSSRPSKRIVLTARNPVMIERIFMLIGSVMVLAAFLGMASRFGGISSMFTQVWEFKHVTIEDTGYGDLTGSDGIIISLSRRLMPFSKFVLLIAVSCALLRKSGNNKMNWLFVGLGVAASMMEFGTKLSRGVLVLIVLMPLILYLNIKRRALTMQTVMFGVFFAIVLLFGKAAFSATSALAGGWSAFTEKLEQNMSNTGLEEMQTVADSFVWNFSHRIASTVVAREYVSEDLTNVRHIEDFYNIPLAYVGPFMGVSQPPTITDLNTLLMFGSNFTNVPPGTVAFSVYSFWMIGPAVYGLLFGLLFGTIEKFLIGNWNTTPVIPALHCYGVLFCANTVIGFEPRSMMASLPILVIVVIFFRLFYCKTAGGAGGLAHRPHPYGLHY